MPDQQDDDLAIALAKRFIERKDVKAIQARDGSWMPDRVPTLKGDPFGAEIPLRMGDLRHHLAGTKTFGHYMLSAAGNCRVFAFDIDLNKTGVWADDLGLEHEFSPREAWLNEAHPTHNDLLVQLRCMAEGLAIRTKRLCQVPVAVSTSGSKGIHVYAFIGSTPAADARGAAREVLDSFHCFKPSKGENFFKHETAYRNLTIEIFPKQDSLEGKDFGNLMALPLGISQKTRQERFFVDLQKGCDTLSAEDPTMVLELGSVR